MVYVIVGTLIYKVAEHPEEIGRYIQSIVRGAVDQLNDASNGR